MEHEKTQKVKDWDHAFEIAEEFNLDKEEFEPKWTWDCNYKLDFDGPLVVVTSRFYPPTPSYGEGWDGSVYIQLGDEPLIPKKEFKEDNLEDLKDKVEAYVKEVTGKIKLAISEIDWSGIKSKI
jgi:hypothetical protein